MGTLEVENPVEALRNKDGTFKVTSPSGHIFRVTCRRGRNMRVSEIGSSENVSLSEVAHHDRFDGSGYHPTQGEQIPLEARIIAVADVYDACTSDRPYRRGMSPFEARETIVKGAGTEFDPHVVDGFLRALSQPGFEVPEVMLV